MTKVSIRVDGKAVEVPEGANLGALLHGIGDARLRGTEMGAQRGLFCGMGTCFDCVVLVDGRPARACLTAVRPGMAVERPGRKP